MFGRKKEDNMPSPDENKENAPVLTVPNLEQDQKSDNQVSIDETQDTIKKDDELESKPIEVIALRPGYFASNRVAAETKFTIPSFSQLGSWMECTDPEIQKLHLEAIEAKKPKKRV